MKIPLSHIKRRIIDDISDSELSKKLLQLGHEHEIENGIIDFEFTPNRGDCLSVNGILRDLSCFYKINSLSEIFNDKLQKLSFNFVNKCTKSCPEVTFLKIEVDEFIRSYSYELEDYFADLKLNKINFFTDISNYISYETGQPTHCYDANKIDSLVLKEIKKDSSFETLLDKNIKLLGSNLVFKDNDEIVNLAGVIGGKNSACDKNTRSVIVECAYFLPEAIIGKSLKYDIQSDAAHKFERGVDRKSQETVLRRFLKVVNSHADILKAEIINFKYNEYEYKKIPFDYEKINKIIGESIDYKYQIKILTKLGFIIEDKLLIVPPHRNDITSINDVAEEIARVYGYDNIITKPFSIKTSKKMKNKRESNEEKLKKYLIDNNFYEVINNPFTSSKISTSIKLDNPLDSNKRFIRTDLKDSLIHNLIFNNRRQKDSIKLFEISEIYEFTSSIKSSKKIGIISTGVCGHNYKDFSNKVSLSTLEDIFKDVFIDFENHFQEISLDEYDVKIKTPVFYGEFDLENVSENIENYKSNYSAPKKFIKYQPISEFPSSIRDLSFSIKEYKQLKKLEEMVNIFSCSILKETFIFDFFINEKRNEIKIGYRFIFQSKEKTLTDEEIDKEMDAIISKTLSIDNIYIPGL